MKHKRVGVLPSLVNEKCRVEGVNVKAQFDHVQRVDAPLHGPRR